MNHIANRKHNKNLQFDSSSNRTIFHYISPLLFIFSFLVILSVLLYTIHTSSQKEQTNDIKLLSERISKGIEIKLKGNLDYLTLIAKARSAGNLSENDLSLRVSSFLIDHPEFINITWIDSNFVIKTVCPLKGNSHIIGLPIELPEPKYASRKAKETKQNVYTHAFEAIQSKSSFEVWVPVYDKSKFLGLFAGVYSCENVLKNSIPDQSFYNTHVQLLDKNSIVVSEFPKHNIEENNISIELPLFYLENGMKIRIIMEQVQAYSWIMIILFFLCVILVLGFAYTLWKMNLQIEMRKKIENSLTKNENILKKQNEKYFDLSEKLIKSSRNIKKANIALKIAKDHAEESDRLKTAFLQNMSHEIRTPMNAIIGFSDLLSDNFENKAKLERFAKIINQRCNDLLHIITDILDIAKIESGQLPVNISVCKLKSLCEELNSLFEDYQTRMINKNIQFRFKVLSDLSELTILTDQAKLKQIFTNLIDNAYKFTDVGSIEGICRLTENNKLVFSVSDTGIGIPKEKQTAIFDRFVQIEHSSNKNIGGTGIGLSIVNGLVEILGAEITLDSEVGKGSTFSISFPAICLQKLILQEKIEEEVEISFEQGNRTILLVEDDLYNSDFIREILNTYNFTVLKTISGSEAVEISKTQKLDLVLMDIRLPDIDGYEATRQIKLGKPNLKIIAQTAFASKNERQKAIDAGCSDYISKPIDRKVLLDMLKEHLLSSN